MANFVFSREFPNGRFIVKVTDNWEDAVKIYKEHLHYANNNNYAVSETIITHKKHGLKIGLTHIRYLNDISTETETLRITKEED